MAKLRGKAKAKFLARMKLGRNKATAIRKRAIKKKTAKKKVVKRKKNPVTQTVRRKINGATKLFRRFTGMEPEFVDVRKLNVPDVGMIIGKLDGVLYTTERDGRQEEYIHKFTGRSRPTLCASWDGKQVFIVDGKYNFTAEGIVDKK